MWPSRAASVIPSEPMNNTSPGSSRSVSSPNASGAEIVGESETEWKVRQLDRLDPPGSRTMHEHRIVAAAHGEFAVADAAHRNERHVSLLAEPREVRREHAIGEVVELARPNVRSRLEDRRDRTLRHERHESGAEPMARDVAEEEP